jgi:hypothetical protein
MDSLAFAQIEHFNGIVAERTNEQPVAGSIKREMVYSSFNSRQRDRLRLFDPRVTGLSGRQTSSGCCDTDGKN